MHHGLRVAALASCLALATACGDKGEPASPSISPEQAAKMIALENRGIGALERFDYTDAAAPLREALAIAPKWISGRFNLALALVHAGRDKPTEAMRSSTASSRTRRTTRTRPSSRRGSPRTRAPTRRTGRSSSTRRRIG
jgi:Tfp pilus assembly protein PilF